MPEESIESTDAVPTQTANDARLYIPHPEGWEAHIKGVEEREYCHFKTPGQDYYHLLMPGEIYLQRGYEKYCLQCAIRNEVATRNRLYWQRESARPTT